MSRNRGQLYDDSNSSIRSGGFHSVIDSQNGNNNISAIEGTNPGLGIPYAFQSTSDSSISSITSRKSLRPNDTNDTPDFAYGDYFGEDSLLGPGEKIYSQKETEESAQIKSIQSEKKILVEAFREALGKAPKPTIYRENVLRTQHTYLSKLNNNINHDEFWTAKDIKTYPRANGLPVKMVNY